MKESPSKGWLFGLLLCIIPVLYLLSLDMSEETPEPETAIEETTIEATSMEETAGEVSSGEASNLAEASSGVEESIEQAAGENQEASTGDGGELESDAGGELEVQGNLEQSYIVDVESPTSQGNNDTLEAAQPLGALDATAFGYINARTTGDIDLFAFTLEETSTVYFDIDFANDINTPNTDDDDGLDALISVFDAEGNLVGEADDVTFPPDPGSGENGDYDPFLELELDPGDYYVGVSAWPNFSEGSVDGYDEELGYSSGEYCLAVRTSAGLDAPPNQCLDQ